MGVQFKVLALGVASALFFLMPMSAFAAEAICPGGSAPNASVVWCDDLETPSSAWVPQSVRCDDFGFGDRCAVYSGPLNFDNEYGYFNWGGDPYIGGEYDNLYVRLYVKFSDPYNWGNVDDKGIYFQNSGGASVIHNVKMEYSSWGTGKPNLASYALLNRGERLYQNQGNDLKFEPGRWYMVEMHIKLNTPGVPDGVYELWVDDMSRPISNQILRLRYTDLLIRPSGNTRGYNTLFLTSYHQRCNLGSACPRTLNQWVIWDNMVVSRAKIGPVICHGRQRRQACKSGNNPTTLTTLPAVPTSVVTNDIDLYISPGCDSNCRRRLAPKQLPSPPPIEAFEGRLQRGTILLVGHGFQPAGE